MSEVDDTKLKIDQIVVEEANEKVQKEIAHYRNVLMFMGANVPIQALCLPSAIENALIASDCLRVYDLINRDLTKIKGIGKSRSSLLASRLDEFFTVSI